MNTIDDIDHDPRYQILRQTIARVERATPEADGSFWAATDELLAGVAWHELRDDIYEARSWLSSLTGDESADRARQEGDTLEVLCNLWFAIEQLRGDDGPEYWRPTRKPHGVPTRGCGITSRRSGH